MPKKIPPMPWTPAKIPRPIKINLNKYIDPWFGDNKAKKMFETLKKTKKEVKERKAKKISFKKVSDWRYEVSTGGKHLGDIETDLYNRWKLYPKFEYDELIGQFFLNDHYDDFNKAGRGLVELWINS
jgi:hypothetical protein